MRLNVRQARVFGMLMAACAVIAGSVISGPAASASDSKPSGVDPETALGSLSFREWWPEMTESPSIAAADPVEVFGEAVVSRVEPGATVMEIATDYTLVELFGAQAVADLAARTIPQTAAVNSPSEVAGGPNLAIAECRVIGLPSCGVRFTNTESRIVMNAALGGSAAAYQVACALIPNPIIAAACRVGSGAFFAGAIAAGNIVLSDRSRCLYTHPFVGTFAWHVVSC